MMGRLKTHIFIVSVVLLGSLFILGYQTGFYSLFASNYSPRASLQHIDASVLADLETATFALGCFWGAESLFGSTPGVIRTRVGYAGGTREDPTSKTIGGHTETLQLDHDPTQISYIELLEIFWDNHDPYDKPWSQQYKSVIFYHSEAQRELAHEMKADMEAELNKTLYTEIRPFSGFYIAEDYHQKYRLRQEKELMKEFEAMYPDNRTFIDSTEAARVNGFVSGYGDPAVLKDELGSYGLSEKAGEHLVDRFNMRVRAVYCPTN